MDPTVLLRDSDLQSWMKKTGISVPPSRTRLVKDIHAEERKVVLLTGCTGYLGKFILLNLLNSPWPQCSLVYCHIRASASSARDRLFSILSSSFPGHPDTLHSWFKEKIRIVEGDLSKPLIGLDQATFQHLAHSVDVIIHNGALVNHLRSYEDLRRENVDSTKDVLHLAMTGKPKFLHFVSSMVVIYHSKKGGQLNESKFLDVESAAKWVGYSAGYSATKWVCEALLQQAIQNGFIDCAISRPGPIGPNTASGEGSVGDWLYYLFHAMMELGMYPERTLRLSPHLYLTPVDHVARGITAISLKGDTSQDLLPGAQCPVYHYRYSHQPLTQEHFVAALMKLKQLRTVEFEEFRKVLSEKVASRAGSIQLARLNKILSFFPTADSFTVASFVGEGVYYSLSDEHTRKVLSTNYSVYPPSYDEAAVARYSRWLANAVAKSTRTGSRL